MTRLVGGGPQVSFARSILLPSYTVVRAASPTHASGPHSCPFSHPDWTFEVKWDGLRALAYIEGGKCKLVSRKGNDFRSFPRLTESIASALTSRSAVLDEEIVWLDRRGKPQFTDPLLRRGEPRFVAFDLLRLDGEDLCYLPLMERKAKLRALVSNSEWLMYCDHIEAHGEKLFKLARKRDLEGIVAKRKYDPGIPESAQWMKIRNPAYSQWVEPGECLSASRIFNLWDVSVMACEMTGQCGSEPRAADI